MKTILIVLLVAVLAAAGGWWFGANRPATGQTPVAATTFQCPMHPWIKSDHPGKCTICGMDLVAATGGNSGDQAASTNLVMLPQGSAQISGVRTAEVKIRPLIRTLRVAGTIEDDDSKHRILSAYAGGRIEKLFVTYDGAEVEAGQPLATYYSKELLNAVREYKIIFRQGPSPLLTATEMRLRQLGLSAEQIAGAPQREETDIFVDIVAPDGGTVVKRYVYEGQYVQEGEKLFEIADFSTMWFQFIAYEQDLPFLREGLPVTISTPSLPGQKFTSTIKFINPNLDDLTRSARVRVEIKNPTSPAGLHRTHELLHKLYAEGVVALAAPEVVAVPRGAVLWTGTHPRVFVEKESGSYEERQIILGRSGDEFWEVLEGVKPGEKVVASGNMLIDGQAQLNNLAAPEEKTPAAPPVAEPQAVAAYLAAVAAITDALAEDDLVAYNAALARLPAAPKDLAVKTPTAAADLAQARRDFLPLSQAVADYARPIRGQFAKLKIFRCPMSEEAGEGIPNNAKWIQFTADLRNPYMGQEMLHCGVEVE